MSVKIRLKRTGRRHQPSFRIVAMEEEKAQNSKTLEKLGFYNPAEEQLEIDTGKALNWLKNGAKPSKTVRDLLSKKGVIEEFNNLKKES